MGWQTPRWSLTSSGVKESSDMCCRFALGDMRICRLRTLIASLLPESFKRVLQILMAALAKVGGEFGFAD